MRFTKSPFVIPAALAVAIGALLLSGAATHAQSVAGSSVETAAASPRLGDRPGPNPVDTTGTRPLEWLYDTWTVSWRQVRGALPIDPGSHVTLVAIVCESATLQHDRLARHLNPEECEHLMAPVRADLDTALIFRVHLRLLKSSGSSELVQLDRHVQAILEDDAGWQWTSANRKRGAMLGLATGRKVKRLALYHPQWMRGSDVIREPEYWVTEGENVTTVEYWIRFPRWTGQGERILTQGTRWLRLRLLDGRNEWVATWPFHREEALR